VLFLPAAEESRMRYVLTALLILAMARPALAQEDSTLTAQLQTLVTPYQGKVALYATDLRSGKTIAINADAPVPTASVIKLTILFEALKQIQSGQAHFEDHLTLEKPNQVPGSGLLRLFDTPLTLTLKDTLTMMVIVSDNTATNLAIDDLGLANIDSRIQWMGLQNTWLYKKVFMPATGPEPADQAQFGLGKTTAREMASVMQRFATCDLTAPGDATPPSASDQALCDTAIGILKEQTDDTGIRRDLDPALVVANKSGALDDTRNDVGIVYAANGPIIISAFTHGNVDQSWTRNNAGQVLIGKLAKTIVDAWQ
jgi:beta-lactamase class A